MTNALNKTIIEGRVVRVPKLKQTENGLSYCTLILAINESTFVDGKWKKTANYITVSLWNKTAVACATYLQKGQWVRVSGKLRQASWIDKNSIKHSRVEVNCNSIEFLLRDQKKSIQNSKPVNENVTKSTNK